MLCGWEGLTHVYLDLKCRNKFGSVEKYLDHIGFESDDRDRLRKVMLE